MLMKKKVKQYAERIGGGSQHPRHVQKDFSRTLDTQLKMASCVQVTKILCLSLKPTQHCTYPFHAGTRVACRAISQLLVFVELKAIGLRKILKPSCVFAHRPRTFHALFLFPFHSVTLALSPAAVTTQ
ncbi:hypothetical protein F2Q68_00016591 [Brassica cretica]|uniref:Uncharacterized protein n=1 Tax=Brassica cretica TaxID=69181 RepID=A0A8S9HQG0_BRACR|nr:hypothetical protein F2Q68_00016591 [Brassica cretica]